MKVIRYNIRKGVCCMQIYGRRTKMMCTTEKEHVQYLDEENVNIEPNNGICIDVDDFEVEERCATNDILLNRLIRFDISSTVRVKNNREKGVTDKSK